METPWMTVAEALKGEAEFKGSSADNPRIREMYVLAAGVAVEHDETPWCAAFVGACLSLGGFEHVKTLRAADYRNFGRDVTDMPEPGAIVVLRPQVQGASGHVAFLSDIDAAQVHLLGGNQRDSVRVSSFARTEIVAIRWPVRIAPVAKSQVLPNILTLASGEAPDNNPEDAHPVSTPGMSNQPNNAPPLAFARAVAVILEFEGGFVNNPADPGGATNFGITLKTLQAARKRPVSVQDVEALGREEAVGIYKLKYWDPILGDQLPAPLGLMTFNAGVLFGPSGGVTFLQKALNQNGHGVDVDGEMGPQTLGACRVCDVGKVVQSYSDLQRARHVASPNASHFLNGWLARLDRVTRAAMALTAEAPPRGSPEISANEAHRITNQLPIPQGGQQMAQPVSQDAVAVLQRMLAVLAGFGQLPAGGQTPQSAGVPTGQIGLPQIISILQTLDPNFKTLDSAKTAPADSKLGPVNGALGPAIGNFLNGKKSLVGIIGATLAGILSDPKLDPGTLLGKASTAVPALAGLGTPLFYVSLALGAWGALGKLEKWNQSPTEPVK